jgi:Bacterial pre-peptidase C-terminal domain/Bacterial SH3 domain
MRKIIFLLVLSLLWVVPVLGQDETLVYDTNWLGTVSSSEPVNTYAFNGAAGDLVTIQVIGIDIDPVVSLNSPTGEQLATNDNEAPGTTDAHIALSLPQSGAYTIQVSSATSAVGLFVLRLNGQAPPPATALTDAPLDASITPDSAQFFSFGANPTEITTLNISTATEGFTFRVTVTDSNGNPVAMVRGSDVVGVSLPFPPGSALYTVEIAALDPTGAGQVSISLSGPLASIQSLPSPTTTVTPPAPEQTEEAVPTTPAPTSCSISPNATEVNVRSGPATVFDIITQLQPSQVLAVTGTANFWFQVIVPDVGVGWVSDRVVFTSGNCSNVPQVEPPATPTVTPTATQAS